MTVTTEEDFRAFVEARWGELETVARLVVLDGPTARVVTTDALADLSGQWDHLLEAGSPGSAARAAVLMGALAARRHRSPARRGGGSRTEPPGPREPRDGPDARIDPDDAVGAALLAVVRAADPLQRAALAAATAWGLDPGRVAGLLGMPPSTVHDADTAVRHRLLEAHTTARAAAGWEPAPWALDRDLEDALDLLVADHSDPPDAAALVGDRHRQVRRRSVLLGAGATLAAGAAVAWVVETVATGASSQAAPQPPRPGDAVWVATNTWPARGRLAGDAGIATLVAGASPRAHLLWADDLAGRRVVVAASADASGSGGTAVQMWAGRSGAAAASLAPVDLVRDRIVYRDDIVPIAVDPAADGALGAGPADGDPDADIDASGVGAVLLLARPTVLEASYSPVVTYARDGGVRRTWTEVALRDGVAILPLRGPMPPAFRVRLDGYDGGPLGAGPLGLPTPDPSAPLGAALVAALGPFIASCTGIPAAQVRSTVVLQAPVAGDVLVPAKPGVPPGPGQVVVAHSVLPGGAQLRTVRVAGDGRGGVGPIDVETTRLLGTSDRPVPLAARLPGFSNDVSRFLVIAPGAARAQLIGTASNTYPASEVTALRDGTSVLEVADARRTALYRLVTWDSRGRRLGGWEALFRRRDPRDLWPRVR